MNQWIIFFLPNNNGFWLASLYASWTPEPNEDQPEQRRKFLADANVGIFFALYEQPLVPDFFLSLDVEPHNSYFFFFRRFTSELKLTIVIFAPDSLPFDPCNLVGRVPVGLKSKSLEISPLKLLAETEKLLLAAT